MEDEEYKELEKKLKSHIAKIQETIEEKEFDYNDRNWEIFLGETFEQLIRRNSLQQNCEDCDFVAINKARLKHHQRNKHRFKCDECGTDFYGTTSLEKHNKCVHIGSDEPLSLKETNALSAQKVCDIDNGPKTPRWQSLRSHDFKRKFIWMNTNI